MKYKTGLIVNVNEFKVIRLINSYTIYLICLDTSGNNQDKVSNDEFELIQLALVHLTSSNRQFIYVILHFFTQCVRNNNFCSNDGVKLRV